MKFKSGFIAIIGKTNVGKSTLLNSLVGEKVAITTYKTQTTRTAIRAIVNRKNSQLIFIDTPGIHNPKTKLGNVMIEVAWDSIKDSDIVLFLVPATIKALNDEDRKILEKLKESKKKVILAINKMDLVKKENLLKLINLYKDKYEFEAIIPISATKNENTDELLVEIEKHLKEGPAYYDIDEYTDQTERMLIEEVIREKALKLLDEEVPHGIYVEVDKMKERKTAKGEPIYDVEATIYTLKNSHKGIIIGKNGEMLKRIGTYARQDLEKSLGIKINLKLWVKVREEWQNNSSIVKKFQNK